MELVQHCCVSCRGTTSHLLPEGREAPAVHLDLKANVEDYKVTHYIYTSGSYLL